MAGGGILKIQVTVNILDGVPCSSSSRSLLRWKQHYEVSLNFLPSTSWDALTNAACEAVPDSDVNISPPCIQEIKETVVKLQFRRAAGADGIPLELLKCAAGPISVGHNALEPVLN